MKTPSDALFDLSGTVAMVTGAVGLLGTEHCHALAAHGAAVVAADIDEASAVRLAGEIAATYENRTLGIGFDVTREESVKNAKIRIEEELGSVDVLINNAAINDKFENPEAAAEQSKFENYPLELWQTSLNVNVTGLFLCCQVFGTEMAKRGKGSIINIASTYGMVGPDQSLYRTPDGEQIFYKTPSYPTTKGAVINFTRFLAAYWGQKGVRVNTLSPGGVEAGQDAYFIENYSRRTPLGRMADKQDYRGAVVFLASDASRYMT
ncbi:MAG: SDR family oxidoreductase, partial [Myxococcota bacterium]